MTYEFIIHCDGASRKDGRGGWGWTMATSWGEVYEQCGGEYDTTNNRMELLGAIEAIAEADTAADPKERLSIQLWSDSQYVIKGITEYIDDWRFRLWRTAANKAIKNQDLWKRLYLLNCKHDIDWRWVKGHTGDVGNERADVLAGLGIPPQRDADAAAPEGSRRLDARRTRVPLRGRPA